MLKIIKSAVASIVLTMVVLAGSVVGPQAHNQYLRWEVGESVVQVLHPLRNGGGTGFAVKGKSGKKYIMTNRHVCAAQVDGKIRIVLQDGSALTRKVVYVDRQHDLCLIAGIDKLSPLDVSKQELQVGATLYAVGHPGLRQLTVSSGEYIGHEEIQMLHDARTELECLQANGVMIPLPPIIQILTGQEFACLIKLDTLQTTTVIYGGNSGSPAVNMWGNVIGVVFAGNRSQEHDNYIVPLSEVKRVLNKF